MASIRPVTRRWGATPSNHPRRIANPNASSGRRPRYRNSTPCSSRTRPPVDPALPDVGLSLDLSRTALLVTDPQIDSLNPKGAAWGAFGESITEHRTIGNLGRLFEASKRAGKPVVISPATTTP